MERFCKELRDHTTKIINYEEKKMILLTDKENKSYEKQKVCYICKKEFNTDKNDKSNLNHTTKYAIIIIILENIEELLIVFAI